MVDGFHCCEEASQTALTTGPASSHVQVTTVPALKLPPQSDEAPDGAVGGSSAQAKNLNVKNKQNTSLV